MGSSDQRERESERWGRGKHFDTVPRMRTYVIARAVEEERYRCRNVLCTPTPSCTCDLARARGQTRFAGVSRVCTGVPRDRSTKRWVCEVRPIGARGKENKNSSEFHGGRRRQKGGRKRQRGKEGSTVFRGAREWRRHDSESLEPTLELHTAQREPESVATPIPRVCAVATSLYSRRFLPRLSVVSTHRRDFSPRFALFPLSTVSHRPNLDGPGETYRHRREHTSTVALRCLLLYACVCNSTRNTGLCGRAGVRGDCQTWRDSHQRLSTRWDFNESHSSGHGIASAGALGGPDACWEAEISVLRME